MKAIDIVKVKQDVQDGLLEVEVHNGYILLKNVKSGESVVIGELPKQTTLNWKPLTRDTELKNDRRYLLCDNNMCHLYVGEYYNHEDEGWIVGGIWEQRNDEYYPYIADIHLPDGTFCEG